MASELEIWDLVNHVFLPLKLPGSADADKDQINLELIRLTSKTLKGLRFSEIPKTRSTFKNWVAAQSTLDPEVLQKQIQNLHPGDTFAFHIQAQNACILITIPKQSHETAIYSGFPTSQKSEVVVKNNDLAAEFPSISITIPRSETLNSICFAKQIVNLYLNEIQDSVGKSKNVGRGAQDIRDVSDPKFILWLSTLLVNTESVCSSENELPRIVKKIRDSVIIGEGNEPFRRSGFYFAIKTILQISLIKELGPNEGLFLYKILMIRLMNGLLERVQVNDLFKVDMIMQMMSKIGRRIYKLSKMDLKLKIRPSLIGIYKDLCEKIEASLKSKRDALNWHWGKYMSKCSAQIKTELQFASPSFQLDHKMESSGFWDYLSTGHLPELTPSGIIPDPQPIPRHLNPGLYFQLEKFNVVSTGKSHDLHLFDFEHHVLHGLSSHLNADQFDYMSNLFQWYVKNAQSVYDGDPIGNSRLILTCLKMLQIWDQITTRAYPLLKNYGSGIQMDFAKDLLCPKMEDLKVLNELEIYFVDRNRKGILPSLIKENNPTEISFAVKYAESNPELEQLRLDILADDKKAQEEKIAEVLKERGTWNEQTSEISLMNCDYRTTTWGTEHMGSTCKKCKLKNSAANMKVSIHEKYLPESITEQWAVVFELGIPGPIAVLRDLIVAFNLTVIQKIGRKDTVMHCSWPRDSSLRTKRSYTPKFTLHSSTKSWKERIYSTQHVSKPESEFIVDNEMNTRYALENRQLDFNDMKTLKKKNTFQVEDSSPYSNMQWAVNGMEESANGVIARQYEQSPNISTMEFIEFGSLRCYPSLQYRNILIALTKKSLSFKTTSVLNLIQQALYQAGPPNSGNLLRVAHVDFSKNTIFALEFLEILEKMVIDHRENWMDNNILLSIVFIISRITYIAKWVQVRDRCLQLLSECRNIATKWSNKIQKIISELLRATGEKTDQYRIKLIEVSVCAALTFDVDDNLLAPIMGNVENVILWLQTIARIQDCQALASSGSKAMSINLRNLLRRVKEIGVRLQRKMARIFEAGDCSGLNKFVMKYYSGWDRTGLKEDTLWNSYPNATQVYFCIVPSRNGNVNATFQLDIAEGIFLVDGSPLENLSRAIVEHPDFRRIFPNKVFIVQPFASQPGTMITKDKFEKSYYSFNLKSNGELIVKEHREYIKGQEIEEWELIPEKYFKGNVADVVIKNCSHWWNEKKGLIEFYAVDDTIPIKLTTYVPIYQMSIHEKMGRVAERRCIRNQLVDYRWLIDINCTTYLQIVKIFSRIELAKYINIWTDGNKSYSIEMPRLSLSFSIQNKNGINKRPLKEMEYISKEFRGLKVSSEKLEALVGLESGILLEDDSQAKQRSILIVPFGKASLVERNRVKISINQSDAVSKFFAYEIDPYLRQLKAGESQIAWIYLAYLHEITASPLVEPFTGLTGTERALEILQSGHVWSSEPYDSEALKVFGWIRDLVPIRVYSPSHVKRSEKVIWPESLLSSIAAHDVYHLIVQKLVKDSLRLSFLDPEYEKNAKNEKNEPDLTKLKTEPELCLRAYWRRYKYSTESNPLTLIEFLKKPPSLMYADSFDLSLTLENTPRTFQMSQQIHEWERTRGIGGTLPEKILKSFLLGDYLNGITPLGFPYLSSVGEWMVRSLKQSWLNLYKLAITVKDESIQNEWLHILTSYAFRVSESVPLVQLQILQLIAANSDQFPEPPNYETYFVTGVVDFNVKEAKEFLQNPSNLRPMKDFRDENPHHQPTADESKYYFTKRVKGIRQKKLENEVKAFVETVKGYWPCTSVPDHEFDSMHEIKVSKIKEEFNNLLNCWYQNRELYNFLEEVEQKLAQLCNGEEFILPGNFVGNLEITERQTRVNSYFGNKKLCTIQLRNILKDKEPDSIDQELWEKSKKMYNSTEASQGNAKIEDVEIPSESFPLEKKLDNPIIKEYMENLNDSWAKRHKIAETLTRSKINLRWTKNIHEERNAERLLQWEKIKEAILPQSGEIINKILLYSGIFPRITEPSTLKLLIKNEFNADCRSNEYTAFVRDLIGAFGVILTKEMQGARMIRFAQIVNGKSVGELEYRKELQNPGHVNWIPSQNSSWLLFEIDMDLMIRRVQVTVAESMMKPEGGKNSLLQLNMGEGKTSVIIPLLVLALADGRQLCRVTVLRSLYQINRKLLLNRIGGLNDRRIYNFPCRRDYKIGISEIQTILKLHQECLMKRGIVMNVPEHRLSLELKMYEKGFEKEYSEAKELFKVQEWLRANVRDLLDESDEILQVKHQIIYTLGPQIQIGGGSLRWKILQDLLKLVPKALRVMKANHGTIACVEINERACQEFPFSRILDMSIEGEFVKELAKYIVQGQLEILPEVSRDNIELVTQFLTNNKMSRDEMNKVYEKYPAKEHRQESLLILRGLLSAGVIANTLSRRWRVNYGINPNGFRKMAVPFRAKDVASERTEFGHPDVAICLTQLTYYYSGLTEAQIEESFDKLLLLPDPNEEYQRWMNGVIKDKTPEELRGIKTIRNLSGVNLQDYDQRKILFPLLRTNMQTIDFWLSTVVYPIESKQFGLKISCSPWDLCRENERPCTGFSGTSDSKLLLPKTISQNNIPELEGTDGFVLQNLMLEENDFYQVLKQDITGKEIIDQLALTKKKDTIRVLLDVGALMIDLSNRQVVEYWLSKVDEADAGVYFDEKDKLVVLERKTGNRPVLLELSTFRSRLDRCVIYLDDIHTRGTDLKLPEGTRACLTLGKGVTKDKLVQGAMRMRKLGIGHRVAFWASQEVHNLITSKLESDARVGVKDVINWTIENNMEAIQSGFIHWIKSGVYQAQKLGGHSIYNRTLEDEGALKVLADNCNAKEVVELMDMYGEPRVDKLYPTILQDLLERVKAKLLGAAEVVDSFGVGVKSHVVKYASDLVKCTQELDEEQERELEPEIECERERHVPPKPEAYRHSMCEELKQFIQSGATAGIKNWAIKLPKSFCQRSKIWEVYPMDNWAPNIYATKDFSNVVKQTTIIKSNDFIRTPNFLVTVPDSQGGAIILFISPFEADQFMTLFQSNPKATLRLLAPRLSPDQGMLYDNPGLGLPSDSEWPDNMIISPTMHNSLLLFSGSSYFESKDEMQNYIAYLGLCPQPRSEDANKLCEEGGIVNGFVLKEHRDKLGEEYDSCQFDKDPRKLMREIIEGRFKSFSNSSHVGILVMKNTIPTNMD